MMELKEKIVALCNESGLHIEQILFVLKDVYRDAEDSYLNYKIKKENQTKLQKMQEEANDLLDKGEEELSEDQDSNEE